MENERQATKPGGHRAARGWCDPRLSARGSEFGIALSGRRRWKGHTALASRSHLGFGARNLRRSLNHCQPRTPVDSPMNRVCQLLTMALFCVVAEP